MCCKSLENSGPTGIHAYVEKKQWKFLILLMEADKIASSLKKLFQGLKLITPLSYHIKVPCFKGKSKAGYKNARMKCIFFWLKSIRIWKIFLSNNVDLFNWHFFFPLTPLDN